MDKCVFIDDRPIEELSLKEREERFIRQIGNEYNNYSDNDKKTLLKAFLLGQHRTMPL